MPKLTKEQRAQVEAVRVVDRLALEVAQYQPRLMNAMELATKVLNFELLVSANQFVLHDRNNRYSVEYALTLTHTPVSFQNLETLEQDVNYQVSEQAKAEAVEKQRKAALAKLTDEERKLLNL